MRLENARSSDGREAGDGGPRTVWCQVETTGRLHVGSTSLLAASELGGPSRDGSCSCKNVNH